MPTVYSKNAFGQVYYKQELVHTYIAICNVQHKGGNSLMAPTHWWPMARGSGGNARMKRFYGEDVARKVLEEAGESEEPETGLVDTAAGDIAEETMGFSEGEFAMVDTAAVITIRVWLNTAESGIHRESIALDITAVDLSDNTEIPAETTEDSGDDKDDENVFEAESKVELLQRMMLQHVEQASWELEAAKESMEEQLMDIRVDIHKLSKMSGTVADTLQDAIRNSEEELKKQMYELESNLTRMFKEALSIKIGGFYTIPVLEALSRMNRQLKEEKENKARFGGDRNNDGKDRYAGV